jgi:hypothetical protein
LPFEFNLQRYYMDVKEYSTMTVIPAKAVCMGFRV